MAAKGPDRVQFENDGSSFLPPKNSMAPGQYLQSPNKRFKLVLESDVSLVLYDGSVKVWSAEKGQPFTKTFAPVKAVPSSFYIWCDLVLVDHKRNRCWTTTGSTPPEGTMEAAAKRTYLSLQNDGNIVGVDSTVIWSSVSSVPAAPGSFGAVYFPSGSDLVVGKRYVAGTASMVFQVDGNLVLFGPSGNLVWQTNTVGAVKATMQKDGRLVILNANNVIVWSSGGESKPGAIGRLQTNGGFSIVYDRPTWARFGFTPTIIPPRVFYPDHGTGDLPTFKSWSWVF